jgi:hypothetical protein
LLNVKEHVVAFLNFGAANHLLFKVTGLDNFLAGNFEQIIRETLLNQKLLLEKVMALEDKAV